MSAINTDFSVIDSFTGKHRFLSNFYPSPVEYKAERYPTVEHAYQAAKTLNPTEREMIRLVVSPGTAKQLGRTVHLRSDWDSKKELVMLTLLRQKFHPARHPDLHRQLLETGNAVLIEGNHWGDTYWGMCDGVGTNRLGELLMQVREEYRL